MMMMSRTSFFVSSVMGWFSVLGVVGASVRGEGV
jgi:hypothetical protein